MLYSLGDSHTWCTRGPFSRLFVDGLTLHRFGRDGEAIRLVENFFQQPNDQIILLIVLGEIDVRCHIKPQLESGRELKEIVDTLSQGALYGIASIAARWGIISGFCGVIPPIEHEDHPGFPRRGTIQERVSYQQALNDSLWLTLVSAGVPFFEPYGPFTEPDGTLRPADSDGTVHLSRGCGHPVFGPIASRLLSLVDSRVRISRDG